MPQTDSSIAPVIRAYQDAVFQKNVDAFASLYAADVRVFDTWGVWSYDGLASWRAMVTDWLSSLGTERVAVEFSDVQADVAPPLAVVHAFVAYKSISASGEEQRSMTNRLTWVLRQEHDAWKITHEHTSAPADFESYKVLLQR